MSGVWTMVEPAAREIVAVLFNGLWQGAAIALAVWAILRIFPNANASTRYAAWSAALLAVMIVPLVTTLPRVSAMPPAVVTVGTVGTVAKIPARIGHTTQNSARQIVASKRPSSGSPATSAQPSPWTPPHFAVPAWLAVALFAVWGLVSLASLVRLVVSLVQLEKLKTDSLPLGVEYRDVMARWTGAAKGSRDVRLCVSNDIEVPVAVGLFDAMILLPQHLLERLESHEIDQISLHELAHLRRADDWTNGLQRIAQALLFFNPAVTFVAHQMDLEREVACDDWVLAVTNDVRPYAFCLTKMAEVTAWPHRPLAAPGVFANRKSISIRIERLLAAKRAIGSALAPGASSAVLAALIAAFFVLRTVTPSIAYTGPAVAGTPPPLVVARATSAPVEPVPKTSQPPAHRTAPTAVPAPTERPPSVVPFGPRAVAYTRVVKAAGSSRSIAVARSSSARSAAALSIGAFSCTGCDMHGISWPGRDMHGASLTGADFRGADLHGANFSRARLTGIDLRGANLRDTSFAGADLGGCDLTGAQLDGADFAGANLTGCTFDPSKLSASQAAVLLRSCTGCNFRGANLRDRDLRGIDVTGVDLSGADLRGADLSNAKLEGVNLSKARLDGAKLDGTSFVGCEFRGADLRNVDLSHTSMTGSSLSNAIMR
jgi:uncharacterized protein YjbI with pentapeptide repeats/beta-lactamase regulating signal transducer with metallopeptidase domain